MITDQIKPGTLIGNLESPRTVVVSTLIRQGGDGFYPTHVAVAYDKDAYHKYAVWYVVDRDGQLHCDTGEYFHDSKDAIECWQKRGGK